MCKLPSSPEHLDPLDHSYSPHPGAERQILSPCDRPFSQSLGDVDDPAPPMEQSTPPQSALLNLFVGLCEPTNLEPHLSMQKLLLTAFTTLLNIFADHTNDNLPSQVRVLSLAYMSTKNHLNTKTTKTMNIITRFYHIPQGYSKMKFYQYSSRLQQDEILPVFLKVATRWNFTSISRGYRLSAFSQQGEVSLLCTKGTAFFPDMKKNIMHQGNSFSALSQQGQVILTTTQHFILASSWSPINSIMILRQKC